MVAADPTLNREEGLNQIRDTLNERYHINFPIISEHKQKKETEIESPMISDTKQLLKLIMDSATPQTMIKNQNKQNPETPSSPTEKKTMPDKNGPKIIPLENEVTTAPTTPTTPENRPRRRTRTPWTEPKMTPVRRSTRVTAQRMLDMQI